MASQRIPRSLLKAVPRIFREYYPKSGRGYWRVSPVPIPWRYLGDKQREQWTQANKYKDRMNERESVRLAYIKLFGEPK